VIQRCQKIKGSDMSIRGKNAAGSWWIAALLVIACGGVELHKARQFAAAAPAERTATARNLSRSYHANSGLRFNYYSCDYSFTVDDVSRRGHGECPQPGAGTIVYYDSSDPSLNSLLEFNAASEQCYRNARPWFVVGAFIVLYSMLFTWLGSHGRATHRAGAGAGEAAIDPEQAGPAQLPGLRGLYLEVVNQIHPDRAANEADRALRERLMKMANVAFKRGDAGTLREVLEEYKSVATAS
jgi:hypothetical protein